MSLRSARRLLEHRRGAVRGAPSPPYLWIGIAVVVFLALFQWYQQRQEEQRAANDKQSPPPVAKQDAPAEKRPAKNTPGTATEPPTKAKRPVVLEPSVTTAKTGTAKPTSPAKTTAPRDPGESEPTPHAENPNAGKYLVMHVVDGDTLNLKGKHRVRLIGIDCPEVAHDYKDPPTRAQPWSAEAAAFTKARILNQTVRVEFDPEYDVVDGYDRWLCWVYYRDPRDGSEKLLNEELLRQGLAFAYDDRRKYHYTEAMYRRLKAAQREAQEARRGIYSK